LIYPDECFLSPAGDGAILFCLDHAARVARHKKVCKKSQDFGDLATNSFIPLKGFNSHARGVVKQKAFFDAAFHNLLAANSPMSVH
jgi:hypothetical protein